jgi:hypothetical protein
VSDPMLPEGHERHDKTRYDQRTGPGEENQGA